MSNRGFWISLYTLNIIRYFFNEPENSIIIFFLFGISHSPITGISLLSMYRFIPTLFVPVYPYSLCTGKSLFYFIGISLLSMYRYIPTLRVPVYPYSPCTDISLLSMYRYIPTLRVPVYPYSLCTGKSLLSFISISLLSVYRYITILCILVHPCSLCTGKSLLSVYRYIPTLRPVPSYRRYSRKQ